MVVIVFRGRVTGGEVALSDEHDAFEWLTPGDLARRSPLEALVRAARTAEELPWPSFGGGVPVPAPERGGGA
jgi:hypothetical protein